MPKTAGDTLNVAFVHANVITVDADFTVVEALWVKDGFIQAVGTTQDIKASIDSDTRVVDLAGRTVMPGFIDTHGHIALFGLDKLNVDLAGALSKTGDPGMCGCRSSNTPAQRMDPHDANRDTTLLSRFRNDTGIRRTTVTARARPGCTREPRVHYGAHESRAKFRHIEFRRAASSGN